MNIAYDERQKGTLQVFCSERALKDIDKDRRVLRENGISYEVLDGAGCAAVEPGLTGSDAGIVGGLRLPNDETGDCYKFTVSLLAQAKMLGVQFRPAEEVSKLIIENDKVAAVQTDKSIFETDAVVMCMGCFSAPFVKSLGIQIPVYPVKGYSLTALVEDAARALESTVLDDRYKVAITRLGNRVRVGGLAEVCGYDLSLPISRRTTLERSVESLFPGSSDFADAQFWCGLRPMTPDGSPIIGRTKLQNVLLNTGHGTLGWTMACGSGKLVADIVSGRETDIESTDLRPDRF